MMITIITSRNIQNKQELVICPLPEDPKGCP